MSFRFAILLSVVFLVAVTLAQQGRRPSHGGHGGPPNGGPNGTRPDGSNGTRPDGPPPNGTRPDGPPHGGPNGTRPDGPPHGGPNGTRPDGPPGGPGGNGTRHGPGGQQDPGSQQQFASQQAPGGHGGPGGPGGPDGGMTTCSSSVAHFNTPTAFTGQCESSWTMPNTYAYPDDFTYLNLVQWYECPSSGLRISVSNGIPNHDVTIGNPNTMCTIPWMVEMPLKPVYVDTLTEPAAGGIIAIQNNGVPVYGAQEAQGLNAVEPSSTSFVQDAQYWYGHTAPSHDWHYHNPWMGYSEQPSSDQQLGYAMDGFPIYGPVSNSELSELDSCNGRVVNGQYRYHIRNKDQVDENASYCNGTSPAIQWNYVLGCYHGDLSQAAVKDALKYDVPSDCVMV